MKITFTHEFLEELVAFVILVLYFGIGYWWGWQDGRRHGIRK